MKELFAGIVLILVIGLGGFLYRSVLEHPAAPSGGSPSAVACTQEAKICPDGQSVGRTDPNCEFAACPLPNAEDSEINIAFVIPDGYTANADAIGAEPTLRAVFDKPSSGDVPNSIIIRDYPIEAGQTGTSTILAHTTYDTSGNPAKSISEFKKTVINGKTYYSVVLERFEGQVHSAYYLVRANDVLRFEVLEKDVTNWSDPKLDVATLPEHQALLKMLTTLQTP